MNLDDLTARELQKESARALAIWKPGNNELKQMTGHVHWDSQEFYKAIIRRYIDEYGGLPSEIGPGAEIKLLYD